MKRQNEMGQLTNTNSQSINASPSVAAKRMKKKKFGMPIIVDQTPEGPVAIPNMLQTEKYKNPQRKNNLLDYVTLTMQQNTSSLITIGQSITPTTVSSPNKTKRFKKTPRKPKRNEPHQNSSIAENVPANDKSETTIDMNQSTNFEESIIDNDNSHFQPDESMLSALNETLPIIGAGPVPHFYSLRTKVICVMEPLCKYSFHGKLKIKVLAGAVDIYGATLEKSNTTTPVEVYSSRGTNLVSIQAIESSSPFTDNVSSVWDALEDDNIDRNISNALQTDINNIHTGCAVLILENLENNLTTFLSRYSSHRLFPKIDNSTNYSWEDTKRAEIILQAHIYPDNSGRQTIEFNNVNEVTKKILHKIQTKQNSRIILAGGKNVGKSTTMRYLVNKILENNEAVLVVDVDPGQGEFTPQACISMNIVKKPLLGPNFTHLQTPYHQIYAGGIDVVRCLNNYIQGIEKLMQQVNEYCEKNPLPIVINTMGFCKGIGWDIMCYIIKSIQPTDIIQITSKRSKNNFEQPLNPQTINSQSNNRKIWGKRGKHLKTAVEYELHMINSQAEIRNGNIELWNIEPHQRRDITMLAYLSEIIKSQDDLQTYKDNVQLTINEIIPYALPFSAIKVSLGRPQAAQVLSVMNGNIVALCGTNFETKKRQENIQDNDSYPQVLIRAPLSTCYGFGIVRGVDLQAKMLYINTPLPISQLNYVNCLIGSIPVPSGLLQLSRYGAPYAGGERDLPTSRDPRRGYFRMRYRTDT